MAARDTALPMRVGRQAMDPVRHGTWHQSVSELQAQQLQAAQRQDKFKLAQAVFLQAYGGHALSCLHFFLTHIFLLEIGTAAPQVGASIATCYHKWSEQPLPMDDTSEQQLLVDLYQTCEIVVQAPRSRWLVNVHLTLTAADYCPYATFPLLLDALPKPEHFHDVLRSVMYWYQHQQHEDVDNLLNHLRRDYPEHDQLLGFLFMYDQVGNDTLYDRNGDGVKRQQYVMLLMLNAIRPLPQHRPVLRGAFSTTTVRLPILEVTEQPDLPQIWQMLFPGELALPIYTQPVTNH